MNYMKTKHIKTFENFGAITLTHSPQERFTKDTKIREPNVMSYTGAGRIPAHWNNSPFLSGDSYDSGTAHIGNSPKSSKITKKKNVLDFNEFLKGTKIAKNEKVK